ncbi:MAG: LLM class flavin-dependent oxidoreductase [Actinobacteria bacterium]|nr:LLM class flavin-dependent oxidoreductase [Actinomycetota bacterium]
MTSSVRLGVALPPEGPLGEIVELAAEAEALGCRTVWVNDDRLQKDVFTVLAAIAAGTTELRLGPGVTNPYSRHPALVASAIATLDELSGGRAVLGLGAGGTNHRMLGIERRAPASALREALAVIRGLLAGEEVSVDGKVVHTDGARLDFTPPRADLPIYIGARGPKALEAAGELADGAIVGNVAGAAGWRYALERVDTGARRADRDPAELAMVAWVACAVSEDADAALDAVRPLVATSLVTSRPILDQLGVEMPPGFAAVMEEEGWSLSRDSVTRAAAEVPADIVGRFAIAGTAAECRHQVEELLSHTPRIGELVAIPFAVPGQSTAEVVRRFAGEVAGGLDG